MQAEVTLASLVNCCRLPPTLTRLTPIVERQTCVDNMEKKFVGGIMNAAKRIIGRKAVPVVSSAGKLPSTKRRIPIRCPLTVRNL